MWTRGRDLAVAAAVTLTSPAAAAAVRADLEDGRLAGATLAVACTGAQARFALAPDRATAESLITQR